MAGISRSFLPLAFIIASFACGQVQAAPINIDWVTVGNSGNANDTTGYGAVNYDYRIGKYHVTIGQYTDFLNAAATSDPYGLYNTGMGTNLNIAGILQTGSDGSYSYSVIGSANRPITYISWFDAARFANWMQNGQGNGSTETGAYTLVGGQTSGTAPAANPGATYRLPSENEWYKAAYYSPVKGGAGSPGYYKYATQSDSVPGNLVGSGTNQVNYGTGAGFSVTQSWSYSSSQNYLTDVGAFTNSASYYGTFDQSGNVYQWNDLDGSTGLLRGLRGGYWDDDASNVSSSRRLTFTFNSGDGGIGFRLAAVPEPSTYAMALAGIACGGFSMWRRRKQA